MSISTALTSIRAWFAGLFSKETTMTEEVTDTSALAATVDPVAETAAVVEVPVAVVATAVSTDTLKSILKALGHDLDAVWDDAVALAKKAL